MIVSLRKRCRPRRGLEPSDKVKERSQEQEQGQVAPTLGKGKARISTSCLRRKIGLFLINEFSYMNITDLITILLICLNIKNDLFFSMFDNFK